MLLKFNCKNHLPHCICFTTKNNHEINNAQEQETSRPNTARALTPDPPGIQRYSDPLVKTPRKENTCSSDFDISTEMGKTRQKLMLR